MDGDYDYFYVINSNKMLVNDDVYSYMIDD